MKATRRIVDKVLLSLTTVAVIIAIVPLVAIIFYVTVKGISAISIGFFTELPPLPASKLQPSPPGGLGNAVQGTLILVGLASAIGVPVGVLSGVYISEYGRNAYGNAIRFLGDTLVGIPSVVTGLLFFGLIVLTFRSYSVIAGSIALGTLMIPIVSNTTAAALQAVPNSLREASSALGVRKWRTSLLIISHAQSSIATGCLLAVARIAGETAPVLLTAGASNYWYSGLGAPIASLTYYIYNYAVSGTSNWVNLAWAGALVLMVVVMGINLVVRLVTRKKYTYG